MLCDGRLVADHERIWARHQTISDPEHVAAARSAARGHGSALLRPAPHRRAWRSAPLSDYDTALGLTDDAAVA